MFDISILADDGRILSLPPKLPYLMGVDAGDDSLHSDVLLDDLEGNYVLCRAPEAARDTDDWPR